MKILHTADIHLGAKFKGVRNPAFSRSQLQNTFAKIIDFAIREKAALLLIAGDLFDSPHPGSRLIEFVSSQFQRLNAQVCLVPGTHEGELYNGLDVFRNIPNLTVFLGREWNYRQYPHLNITVYGINPEEKHPLKGISPKTNSRYHIALLHASYLIPGKTEDEVIITAEEISSCGMNYIALGHWHNLFECSQQNVQAFYPGSPEPVAIDEHKSGNVILIDEMKPSVYKIGTTRCEEIDIDVSDINELEILKERLAAGAEMTLRRRVNLKGISSLTLGLNTEQLTEDLAPGFCQLQIIDKTTIPSKDLDPETYTHRPFIKRYLELVTENINSSTGEGREIAEQALHYGLALLEGKEVL